MRKNGCDLPLNSLQIVAWILTIVFQAIYFIWYIPILPLAAQIVLGIAMGILTILSLITLLITSLIDASDPNLTIGHMPENIVLPPGRKHVIDENFYCALCQVIVGPKSKHCSLCNKCVGGFDHHCKWLNTCIGEKNYKSFFIYLSSTFFGALFHFGVGLALFIEYLVDKKRIILKLNEIYDGLTHIAFITIVVFFILLSLPAIYLLGQLFIFHVQLKWNGISTYDYIIRKREQEKENTSQLQSARKEAFTNQETKIDIHTYPPVRKKTLPPLTNKSEPSTPPNSMDDFVKETKKETLETDQTLNTVTHSS